MLRGNRVDCRPVVAKPASFGLSSGNKDNGSDYRDRAHAVISHIRAKSGRSGKLGKRLLALVAPSRAEQGCINYDLHRSTEDPELWCVYENWRSADDLAAHFELLAPI